MDWGDWSSVASVYQAVVVTIVGLWAYFRFRKERTHHPHIDFSVDCKIYGESGDRQYVAEFLVILKNHGYVQQRFEEIILKVRAIKYKQKRLLFFRDAPKGQDRSISYDDRLFIPLKLIRGVDIVPEKYKPYVIEPGCEEEIRYVTPIPSSIKYMLVHAKYFYPKLIRPVSKNRSFIVHIFKLGK